MIDVAAVREVVRDFNPVWSSRAAWRRRFSKVRSRFLMADEVVVGARCQHISIGSRADGIAQGPIRQTGVPSLAGAAQEFPVRREPR